MLLVFIEKNESLYSSSLSINNLCSLEQDSIRIIDRTCQELAFARQGRIPSDEYWFGHSPNIESHMVSFGNGSRQDQRGSHHQAEGCRWQDHRAHGLVKGSPKGAKVGLALLYVKI